MATFSRVILWENAALKLGGSLGFDTLTPTQDRQSIDHGSNCGENVHFQWKEAKQTAVFSFFSHLNPIWVKSETSLWPKTPISERFIQNMMLPNCHCNKWGNLKCPFFYGLFLSAFYASVHLSDCPIFHKEPGNRKIVFDAFLFVAIHEMASRASSLPFVCLRWNWLSGKVIWHDVKFTPFYRDQLVSFHCMQCKSGFRRHISKNFFHFLKKNQLEYFLAIDQKWVTLLTDLWSFRRIVFRTLSLLARSLPFLRKLWLSQAKGDLFPRKIWKFFFFFFISGIDTALIHTVSHCYFVDSIYVNPACWREYT